MIASEFRSKRLAETVRPETPDARMATELLISELLSTLTFPELPSMNKPAFSFRERSELETVTFQLFTRCTPLPIAGVEGR